MKLFQISDIHIPEVGQPVIHDIDARGNFLSILAKALEIMPDLIVVSGDLCYESGKRSIYLWIKEQLDNTGLAYRVMVGNHDNAAMMATIFDLPIHDGECYYRIKMDMGMMLFLDTSQKVLSPHQWAWLAQNLEKERCLIMMHHPPVLAQMPFMDDNHSFEQIDRFGALMTQSTHFVPIFCGHYHIEKTIPSKNFAVFLTPSTIAQMDSQSEEFAIDHFDPGYRLIDWSKGELATRVAYL